MDIGECNVTYFDGALRLLKFLHFAAGYGNGTFRTEIGAAVMRAPRLSPGESDTSQVLGGQPS